MADLSKHFENGINEPTSGGDLKPGRYNLSYTHTEEVVSAKNPDWKGIKIHFNIEDTNIRVGNLFTLAGSQAAKDVSEKSLYYLAKASGVQIESFIKNTDLLAGRPVSCELIRDEKGYLEIDDNYGQNWDEPILPNVGKSNENAAPVNAPDAAESEGEW